MRRGTTPINVFTTDVDLTDASVIFLTYQQFGKTVIEIEKGDRLEVEEDQISVRLTQSETLMLDPTAEVRVQIRAGFDDGSRIASNIMRLGVQDILKDGEI